jgi:serine/threonine protein kinase
MLTGQVPFHSDSEFEIMKAHVEEVPRDPAALNPKIPKALCDVILKVLAKNPQERFQSAEELRNALLRMAQVPGAATAALPSGQPLPAQGPAFSGYGAELESEGAPRGASGEAQLFLGRFDRKVSYLIMGMASILIALLMYVLFSQAPKEEGRKNRIPLTLAPPSAVGPSSPMTVSNGSHSLETNPVQGQKLSDVPPGSGDGPVTITKPPPVSIDPPQAQPEPLVTAEPPEPPKSAEWVHPREPPRKPVASVKKERKKTVKYSETKSQPAADGSTPGTSENKSAGENDKWAIIK